jgi:signal transduction histidine kinase
MSAMRPYPVPTNETARAEAVEAVRGGAEQREPLFEEVAEIAREALGAPVGLVTLIDSDSSCFLAHVGTEIAEVPKEFSLCAHSFASRRPVVVPDALADPRWADQPVVTGGPRIRFYAGVPVILSAGFAIGTVCVADVEPHPAPTGEQIRLLERLARVVARAHEIPIEPDAAASAALQAAQRRAQDEFLALVGHELRTPLNGIVGVAELMEPTGPDRELHDALRCCSDHLSDVVENVLTFTQLRSGEMTLDEGESDLDAVLDRVAASFGSLARSRSKALERGAGGAGRVRADEAKIELAAACLVSNAVMHGGAEAEMSAWRRPGGGIVIEVSDDGRGIDPETHVMAFRAFAPLGDVHARPADGIGLGLPLARRLVELHGGSLSLVRSGERFLARIELPAFRSLTG